ncbi:hypothetical protein P186_1116 [Pyrobaculum ferrireducens]|uniref:Uncharacterized protein n=1 Tax=Pyrobaculum ferrireducens TaxID=1104324 RepID=G7VCC9_9CREN|nr:hypothetical protein P186_1116 [Pyrobaculum ferrireducens]
MFLCVNTVAAVSGGELYLYVKGVVGTAVGALCISGFYYVVSAAVWAFDL